MISINGKPAWYYVVAFIFFVVILFCVWEAFEGGAARNTWLVVAAGCAVILKTLDRCTKGTTKCPNCKNDFTTCRPAYCHCCGQPLTALRCDACAVDWNWYSKIGIGSEAAGNSSEIAYCPACGTFVESEHRRSGSEPWYARTEAVSTEKQSETRITTQIAEAELEAGRNQIDENEEPDNPLVRWVKFVSIILFSTAVLGVLFVISIHVVALMDAFNSHHSYNYQTTAEKTAAKDTVQAIRFRFFLGAVIGGCIGLYYVIWCLIKKRDP